LCDNELVAVLLQPATEFERVDGALNALKPWWLDACTQHFRRVGKQLLLIILMHQLDPQYQFIQRRSLNLRLRVILKLLIIEVLLNHPENHPVTHSASSPRALLAAGFGRKYQL
jgi:hypothetical protein